MGEEVFRHLLHHEVKVTEAMGAITFEVMEVAIEAEVVLASLSYYPYLALVEVGFLDF